MNAFGITDTGRVRPQNQDSIFFSGESLGALPNALVVSDGMGGHRAGEVASQKAVNFFCEFAKIKPCAPGELLDFLVSAVGYANEKVYELSMSDHSLYGMGATFSACVALGAKLYVAHIGDSRVYLSSGGALCQITNDHSYVNELVRAGRLTAEAARRHPRKNELTRALGMEPEAQIDGVVYEAEAGGIVLVCSDGLTNMLGDGEILSILEGGGTLEEKARGLVSAANGNGGHDNISAVLADIRR